MKSMCIGSENKIQEPRIASTGNLITSFCTKDVRRPDLSNSFGNQSLSPDVFNNQSLTSTHVVFLMVFVYVLVLMCFSSSS